MWSKRLFPVAALALCLAALLCVAAAAQPSGSGTAPGESPATSASPAPIPTATPEPAYIPVLTLRTIERMHTAYLDDFDDGTIRPNAPMTRAEVSQMLFWLLAEEKPKRAELKDVDPDEPYSEAMEMLAAYQIISCPNGMARPDEPMTRAEFTSALSRFFPGEGGDCTFSDMPAYRSYYHDVAKATDRGWITGYEDGTFRPDSAVTRAEAAAAINAATGRTPDRDYIDENLVLPLYSDLPRDYWAYYDMLEAAVTHTQAVMNAKTEIWSHMDIPRLRYEEGPVIVGTDLYYINAAGRPVTLGTAGGLYFGADGRYTSGDQEIDGYVRAALQEIIEPDMSREEMLHAAFNYTRDGFTYLKRNYYSIGDTGWTLEEGRTMFRTGLGNCYCYTSVFYYLARQLGYDATAISGVVGHDRSPHGWVEIDFDGVTYIFDTELEMAYRKKGVTSYNFYMMSYSRVPWPYRK